MAATAPERAAEYHASAGFSSTIARKMITHTAAHAKAVADGHTKRSDAMDLGTAVHQLLLRDDRIEVVPWDEWRTNESKAEVARIRAAGRIPMKPKMWNEANDIAEAVREQIVALDLDPVPFTEGTAEHVIRWEDRGVECRAMLDWLRDDLTVIDDLKTTSDASPRGFQRKVWSLRYDIQAAFYLRGVVAAHDISAKDAAAFRFRWVAVETEYPYLVTVHEPSIAAWANAEVRVEEALDRWRECTETGVWPGYVGLNEVGPVPWEADAWAAVEVDESVPF